MKSSFQGMCRCSARGAAALRITADSRYQGGGRTCHGSVTGDTLIVPFPTSSNLTIAVWIQNTVARVKCHHSADGADLPAIPAVPAAAAAHKGDKALVPATLSSFSIPPATAHQMF